MKIGPKAGKYVTSIFVKEEFYQIVHFKFIELPLSNA